MSLQLSPTSSLTRRPHEYTTSSSARSRSPAGVSAAGASSRRKVSSTDRWFGKRRSARGAEMPAIGSMRERLALRADGAPGVSPPTACGRRSCAGWRAGDRPERRARRRDRAPRSAPPSARSRRARRGTRAAGAGRCRNCARCAAEAFSSASSMRRKSSIRACSIAMCANAFCAASSVGPPAGVWYQPGPGGATKHERSAASDDGVAPPAGTAGGPPLFGRVRRVRRSMHALSACSGRAVRGPRRHEPRLLSLRARRR